MKLFLFYKKKMINELNISNSGNYTYHFYYGNRNSFWNWKINVIIIEKIYNTILKYFL